MSVFFQFSKCVKFGTKLTQFLKKITKCVIKVHQHIFFNLMTLNALWKKDITLYKSKIMELNF